MLVTNSAGEEKVKPAEKKDYDFKDGIFNTVLKSASWNVIVLEK